MDVQALHAAVAAVCPIDGVALTGPGAPWPTVAAPDGSLWRIDYAATATAAQQQAARAVVAAWAGEPPDCPSLPWWRTALKLWTRQDGSGASVVRYADVDAAIKGLETATDPDGSANVAVQRAGILAREQFEYANTVLLADLLKLAPAFGFTAADCAESLWRADRVRRGDLTGVWPLPTAA